MKNDECQSWILISRDMKKYVNELLEENDKSNHFLEVDRRDTTERTIHSIIIFTLTDYCPNRSAEVEGHSRRWIRYLNSEDFIHCVRVIRDQEGGEKKSWSFTTG